MALKKTLPGQQPAPWGAAVTGIGPMTVEIFEQLNSADGWVLEIHEGRLIRMPGPGREHGRLQRNLFRTLDAFLQQHQLGGLEGTMCYNLPLPGTTEELLCPDLSHILPARASQIRMRGSYPVIAPDFVIEIASPRDTHPQMAKKLGIYLTAGVQLGWVLWPRSQTIEVWQPMSLTAPLRIVGATEMLDAAPVIPRFTIAVRDLFS